MPYDGPRIERPALLCRAYKNSTLGAQILGPPEILPGRFHTDLEGLPALL